MFRCMVRKASKETVWGLLYWLKKQTKEVAKSCKVDAPSPLLRFEHKKDPPPNKPNNEDPPPSHLYFPSSTKFFCIADPRYRFFSANAQYIGILLVHVIPRFVKPLIRLRPDKLKHQIKFVRAWNSLIFQYPSIRCHIAKQVSMFYDVRYERAKVDLNTLEIAVELWDALTCKWKVEAFKGVMQELVARKLSLTWQEAEHRDNHTIGIISNYEECKEAIRIQMASLRSERFDDIFQKRLLKWWRKLGKDERNSLERYAPCCGVIGIGCCGVCYLRNFSPEERRAYCASIRGLLGCS